MYGRHAHDQKKYTSEGKVLFLASNPTDRNESLHRVHEELRGIQQKLHFAPKRHALTLTSCLAVQPNDLCQVVLKEHPQIVHFCSHGRRDGTLILEDEVGRSFFVQRKALAEFFGLFSTSVKCVLINGCFSSAQADEIANHIDYVIGMKNDATNEATFEFAVSFYNALADGRTLDFAFDYARRALDVKGYLPGQADPVLIKKRNDVDGMIYPKPTSYKVLSTMTPQQIRAIQYDYKHAVALNADDGDSHYQLGLVYLHLKLHDGALRHFKKAIKLLPDDSDTYYYYAVALVRGRPLKTVRHAEIKQVEEYLGTALQMAEVLEPDKQPAKYYYFLGLIAQEYYRVHGLSMPTTAFRDAFLMAQKKSYDPFEIERLLHAIIVRDADLVDKLRRT